MASNPDRRAADRPSRVVLDLAPDPSGDALHGTALVPGCDQPQQFWGALDLLRILESAVRPTTTAERADP
ncbi:hypothetical protein [Nostocoides sp. HKS02]|uniref:hypothetical protein n=1 Tax=Nostocoides sp. HKS02 TaxID=1813880 RepID=UPI0012B4D046|nr:hypothetical protein [Tetrasphaera sp. HKS02]QGN58888.1 hypothetical protein GKE56_14455 [Tetrasphaera sp. HKS02]